MKKRLARSSARLCHPIVAAGAILLAGLANPVFAGSAHLSAIADNTLYETVDGSLSNGAGQHFFSGAAGGGAAHRGLLAFDVASHVPPGSTILAATLTLHMSRSSNPSSQTVTLHRASASWGEGASDAAGNEGGGAPAATGDATWLHRFHDATTWSSVGGDFALGASASAAIGDTGFYIWSGPGLVADLQSWLDAPSQNFGWILLGNETPGTSKRFDSRTHPAPAARPVLEVQFATPVPAGSRTSMASLALLLAITAAFALRTRQVPRRR